MSEKEALIDFCNALEAACVNLRKKLGDTPSPIPNGKDKDRQWSWDPTKINWKKQDGPKGPYERSDDQNNPEYAKLITDLNEHQGKLNRDGIFYWEFQNGGVGRKKS